MHKLGKKIASLSISKPTSDASSEPSAYIDNTATLPEAVFHRYRKHRGVNLGSWFVLEPHIANAPFRRAAEPKQSDLDVAAGEYAYGILNEHYRDWITDEDWDWLQRRGVNAVRLPIGFYHLCGLNKQFVQKSDFESYSLVLQHAWQYIKDAITKAHDRGISVLIDLHAAPGKQNNELHAGTSSSRQAFFSESLNADLWLAIIDGLIRALTGLNLPNIIGIEILNAPTPPSDSSLLKLYDRAIVTLAETDPTLPIYLSECAKFDPYVDYVAKKRKTIHPETILVLDHHLYRCFQPKDTKMAAADHIAALSDDNAPIPKKFAQASEKLRRAGADLIIGEWSAHLSPDSMEGADWEAQRKFVDVQLALFDRYCAGSYFWTYKKQVSGDKGWSFRDAVEGGTVPKWYGGLRLKRKIETDEGELQRRSQRRDAVGAEERDTQINRWSEHPDKYDQHRFFEGFKTGWDDAYLFFCWSPTADKPLPLGSPVSEIGFLGAWARRRTTDHGKSYWEFEQGFYQGAAAARRDFEVLYCT